MRLGATLMALLPMLPAVLLFHRYSPDRVKASRASKRRTPLQYVNALVRPLSRLLQPQFRLAAATPGRTGQVLGDVALTRVTTPAAIAVVLVSAAWSMLCSVEDLSGLLVPLVAFWGVLVSDISTRDYTVDTEGLTGAVPGGVTERYLRNFATATVLWFDADGPDRFALGEPRADASGGAVGRHRGSECGGIAVGPPLQDIAHVSGPVPVWPLYISINARDSPMLDAVGFNAVANAHSVGLYLALAVTATAIGFVYNRQQAR